MAKPAELSVEDENWNSIDLHQISNAAFSAVFEELGLSEKWKVSVLACDDAKIQELNSGFRAKDKPTNVLSWPEYELASNTDGGIPDLPILSDFEENSIGDIAISFQTCKREAAEQGIRMQDHCTHLLIHGCLHLLGYDHETDADATQMEGLESRLLAIMGIENPYKEY